MRRAGLTAGQYQQAMRQLPAQVTDIVTGLASGQSVFMVAIQQGGQLRDSFGGVTPALRALVGLISPTVVAVTAGAGAFALIGKALFDGYREMQRYEQALISTGNTVGLTAGQLSDLADRVGEASNAYGDAETATAALAASGKITGAALEDATRAAVALAKLTGDSIEDTTSKIIKLATAPTKVMEELNSQYHFLTISIYDQVTALEKQGRTQEAAQVAIEAFANVHEQRVKEAEERAGSLEKAWRAVRNSIASAWDGLKEVGKDNTQADLRAAQARLDFLQASRANFPGDAQQRIDAAQAEVDSLKAQVLVQGQVARLQADSQARTDAAIAKKQAQEKAEEEWERLRLANLDRQQKLEQEIADIRKTGLAANKTEPEIKAQEDAARARAAPAVAKPARGSTAKTAAQQAEDAAQRELANLEKQVALLGAVEDGQKRASEEARVRYEIENGGLAAASAATQQQLIDQAKVLDAKRADQLAEQQRKRAAEETEKAYDSLRESLRTPAEVAVDTAIESIEKLNAALKAGLITADEYNAQVGKVVEKSFAPPPSFAGLAPEIGGIDSEQFRLDQASERLQEWYDQRLEQLADSRRREADLNAEWDAWELESKKQYQAKLAELGDAQNQLTLTRGEEAFGAMADMARRAAGEQSTAYRALFAISKGFALAQAVMSLGISLAKAQEKGFPWSFAETASVVAQFANISAIISSAVLGYADGGQIRGPGTRTSDSVPIWASDREYMVRAASATQPGALSFLDDFNRRGMAAVADWRGFADGGLITAAEPRMALSDGPPMQAVNKNNMRVYVVQNEDQLAQRLAQHPALEKAIVVTAGQNGSAIQAQW
ncbi:MAG: phage tail length tape measure family protein [Immundisolibacter sp.]|nr:phage tail length tape measure family protein [Immundisolibacter sp.]